MAVSINLPADQLARMKMLENILEENAINVSERIVKIQSSNSAVNGGVKLNLETQRRASAVSVHREA